MLKQEIWSDNQEAGVTCCKETGSKEATYFETRLLDNLKQCFIRLSVPVAQRRLYSLSDCHSFAAQFWSFNEVASVSRFLMVDWYCSSFLLPSSFFLITDYSSLFKAVLQYLELVE